MKWIILVMLLCAISSAHTDIVVVSQDNLTAWRVIDSDIKIGDHIEIGCVYGPEIIKEGWNNV